MFAYNKEDTSVLIKAIRSGFPDKLDSLSDDEILSKFVLKDDLWHYVRRVTVGVQEAFARVQHTIDVLKGPAGQDENGVSLFKDDAAIDEVWANQQKHLECIQDPPGMNMYTV